MLFSSALHAPIQSVYQSIPFVVHNHGYSSGACTARMGDRADAYEPVSTLASGRNTVTNLLIALASIGTILLTTVTISAQGRGAGRGQEGIPPPQSQRPVPVPEPATLTLLAAAGLGGGLLARHLVSRRKRLKD